MDIKTDEKIKAPLDIDLETYKIKAIYNKFLGDLDQIRKDYKVKENEISQSITDNKIKALKEKLKDL